MAGGRIDIPIEPDLRGFDSKLGAGLRRATGAVGSIVKGLGLAAAAGTTLAVVGLKAAIDKGKEYQANLNELQAVTKATAIDMKKVGDTAKALGSDMSLPATSAADAAAAMVELAKGGLSVNESMKAAKGTLQLAAAAQIGAAEAAEIQANALAEFGLSAESAGHVADVLANTANAASGSIVDMANALKFVGPVAKGLNISIDNTSAALGLLANNGIKGEQAGTSLRGILASLASPSKQAAKALEVLGVRAFDNQGRFVGLRTVTEQLAKAKGRLTDADFAAAASTAFGNEGFTAANALALSGAAAFDKMAASVSRVGGAQDVAASKTKGLGGAIEGFNSQMETLGIGIFEKIAPSLEKGVRGAANVVSRITPVVVSGIEKAVSAGQVFGPKLADAIKSRASTVATAAKDVLRPIAEAVPGVLNTAVNTAIDLSGNATDIFGNLVKAAKPAAEGISSVAKASVEAGGPLSSLQAGASLAGDAFSAASALLIPIGAIIGGIASAFAELPGPIQSAVVALGLAAALKGPLGSLGDTVRDRVTAPFKRMGEEIRLQQALLTGSTSIMSSQIGRVGLAMAALESRVPVIGKIAEAYRTGAASAQGFVHAHTGIAAASLAISGYSERVVSTVQTAGGALGSFSGVVAGTAKAVGMGLRSALGGLVGFLGGPWGVALAAAGVGLSILAQRNADAVRKEQEHKAAVNDLAGALRNAGRDWENITRNKLSEDLVDDLKPAADAAQKFGISLQDIIESAIKGEPVTAAFASKLKELEAIAKNDPFSEQGQAALNVIGALGELKNRYHDAVVQNQQLDEAIAKGDVSMLDATGTGKTLAGAMGILASKTSSADEKARALKEAFDALNGGQVNLEAAQSRLNERLQRLSEAFGENVDKAKGWGQALLNADGSINTTTENGRALFDGLQDISGGMVEVAQKTFDAAVNAGDTLPVALEKAKASAQTTRDAFLAQAKQMGLTAEQAGILADRYGLVPDKVATAIEAPGMSAVQQELLILKGLVDKVPPGKSITVTSLSDEAKQKLLDLGFIVKTLPDGRVQVTAPTRTAQEQLDSFISNNANRSITIYGRYIPPKVTEPGFGRPLPNARGNIVTGYAAGGLRRLTPMRGGVAQMVPANTWRVIGDRMVDPEAYIPINRSSRSQNLLSETARRMGFDVIRRFASGGIATQSVSFPSSSISLAPEVRVFIGDQELRGMVRVEVRESNRDLRQRVLAGAGGEV